MEQTDKTRLIISLKNIIRILGITKEELFNNAEAVITPKTEPKLKEPQLTPSYVAGAPVYVSVGKDENGEETNIALDAIDTDFMSHKSDMAGFLERHPDSLIKDEENKAKPITNESISAPSSVKVEDDDNEVDPSIVDDNFGGQYNNVK
jgi:hypothetical protein